MDARKRARAMALTLLVRVSSSLRRRTQFQQIVMEQKGVKINDEYLITANAKDLMKIENDPIAISTSSRNHL